MKLLLLRLLVLIRNTFEFRKEVDEEGVLASVWREVEFRGAKAWILATAILVASLGLNTNSTAVIIGAMLISPLMGPIVGIGVAVGIWDFTLLLKSLRNLATAVIISISVSALYFTVTPFGEAQSELIARTTPTLLDAMIALFGGLAGAIAVVRHDKSTVIPGVAIATALMPPLCTAGYGIANMNPAFFFGAFYLFFINSVFISFATYITVRIVRFQKKAYLDEPRERRVRRWIMGFLVVTITPSIVIGFFILQENAFHTRARAYLKYIDETFPDRAIVVGKQIYGRDTSYLNIAVIGSPIASTRKDSLVAERKRFGLDATKVMISQSVDLMDILIDGRRLDRPLTRQEAMAASLLASKDSVIGELRRQLLANESRKKDFALVSREVRVLFPAVDDLFFTDVGVAFTDSLADVGAMILYSTKDRRFPANAFGAWLKIRFSDTNLVLRQVEP